MKKTVLITGATAGIGRACAKKFASGEYRVIITGRRKERLDELSEEIEKQFDTDVKTLCFDVRNRQEVESTLSNLDDDWSNIDVLINNAGLASGLDYLHEGNVDDWEKMIDTNVKGLLYVSQVILDGMVKAGSGHVINIGSIAGKEVYPKGNIYCSTKHAVDAITKGMRMDLLGTGVRVTQIAPGAVETEFSVVRFKGDEERASKVYEGYKPLTAEDVAEVTWYVTTLPGHVNINDLVLSASDQASSLVFNK
jgi:NADP-dependent 3-hydroxy acid dehydrogenase YdfG